ncbi:TolC family protein [Negadavirga shengliensis]|uniref:TolC family protein n=1 Tax=Negadavirga shengliensis TaxID=1389218 RepID=A0ABV9T5Q9_9BACT
MSLPRSILLGWALLLPTCLAAQEWTLDACLEYALLHNDELMVNKQKQETGDFQKKAAVSALLPEIDFSAALDHYWKIPVQVFPGELIGEPEGSFVPVRMGMPWMGNIGANANWNLIDPSAWEDIKLATLQAQAAEEDVVAVKKLLIRNVTMAYFQALHQNLLLELDTDRLSAHTESHRLMGRLLEEGQIDQISFNVSKSLLNELEDTRQQSRKSLDLALVDLKFWMGYPLTEPLGLDPHQELPDMAMVLTFSREDLPDYTRHLLEMQISRQQYKSIRSQYMPRLSLNGSFQKVGFGESLNFISNTGWFDVGFVGIGLRLPLLSMQKTLYRPQQYRSAMRAAELEFEHQMQENERRFMKAKLSLESALSTWKSEEQNLKLAMENEKLSRLKLEKGRADLFEYRQIQQDFSLARQKAGDARLAYWQQLIELDYLQNLP